MLVIVLRERLMMIPPKDDEALANANGDSCELV